MKSLEELNEYLFEARKEHFKDSKYRNQLMQRYSSSIENCSTVTLSYITDEDRKREVVKYFIKERKSMIPRIYNSGYIDSNYIIEMSKEFPEIFYSLTKDIILENENIYNAIISNKDLDITKFKREVKKIEDIKIHLDKNKKYNKKNKNDFTLNDINSELTEFFKLENGLKLTSKDDYLKLVDLYLDEDLSEHDFCKKYRINDEDGFISLLNKLNLYNKEDKKYTISGNELDIEDIVNRINNDEMTIEDYLENYYNPYHKFDYIFNNVKDNKKIMNDLYKYITDNEDLLRVHRLLTLFDVEVANLPKKINMYVKQAGLAEAKYNRVLGPILKKFNPLYKRQKLPTGFIKEGKSYEITDDIIDEAITYIKDNDYFLCYKTVFYIIKKILFKELDYKKETQLRKQELKDEILELALEKVENLDEYIDVINKKSKKYVKEYEK